MTPAEKKNWMIGRKSIGLIPADGQGFEIDDEKTESDNDEDNQPLSFILKPPPIASLADSSQTNLKSWRKLPPVLQDRLKLITAKQNQVQNLLQVNAKNCQNHSMVLERKKRRKQMILL